MGFLGLGGKKAAREQAKATRDAAAMTAQSDRFAVQAMQQTQETMLAQQQAAAHAAALTSIPQERVDVSLAADERPAEIDPDTGRRKTNRSPFMAGTSGIRI